MKTRETEKMSKATMVLIQILDLDLKRYLGYLKPEHREKLDVEDLVKWAMERLDDLGYVSDQMSTATVVYTALWQMGYHSRMAQDRGYLTDDDCDTMGTVSLIERYMEDVHGITDLGQDWEDEFRD